MLCLLFRTRHNIRSSRKLQKHKLQLKTRIFQPGFPDDGFERRHSLAFSLSTQTHIEHNGYLKTLGKLRCERTLSLCEFLNRRQPYPRSPCDFRLAETFALSNINERKAETLRAFTQRFLLIISFGICA